MRRDLVVAVLLYLLIALGCAKKPLAVCPEPPPLLWPDLPTDHLTSASTPEEVVRAYAVTKSVLKGRLAEALTLLDGYRTKTPKTVIP